MIFGKMLSHWRVGKSHLIDEHGNVPLCHVERSETSLAGFPVAGPGKRSFTSFRMTSEGRMTRGGSGWKGHVMPSWSIVGNYTM